MSNEPIEIQILRSLNSKEHLEHPEIVLEKIGEVIKSGKAKYGILKSRGSYVENERILKFSDFQISGICIKKENKDLNTEKEALEFLNSL